MNQADQQQKITAGNSSFSCKYRRLTETAGEVLSGRLLKRFETQINFSTSTSRYHTVCPTLRAVSRYFRLQ